MSRQRFSAKRVTVAVISVVLITFGIVFALQDLGTAAKLAGVGSFVVGLVGAAMTATSLRLALRASSQGAGQPAASSESESRPTGHHVDVHGSGPVSVGDHNKVRQKTVHQYRGRTKTRPKGDTEQSA
ncbi:hypothetical protein [Amycolatopsis sp. NPDC004378]